MHRTFGNPALGTFTGFLTVVFLIRITVNLYFVFVLNHSGAALNITQVSGLYFIYLSAYAILVGPLASLHISFALPDLSFIDLSPGRDRFRTEFLRRAILIRPMNLVTAAILIIAVFIFSTMGERPFAVIGIACILLCSVVLSYFIIFRIVSWASPSLPEIQGLELLYLMIIVLLNPDISNVEGSICLVFSGIPCFFESFISIVFGLGIILILSVTILVFFKAISSISSLFKGQMSLSIIESWYWRFFKIRFWIFIYFLLFPMLIIPVFPEKMRLWSLAIFLIFGTLSYLYFISQCENSLKEKWRSSLLMKKNRKLIIRSLAVHIILMLIPVAGFYLFRL